MKLGKYSTLVLVIANLIVTPTLAQQMTAQDQVKVNAYRSYFEPKGFKVVVEENRAVVVDKDNQELMEVPFEKTERLRTYSPKNIQKKLIEEMVKVKTANTSAWSHATKNLPAESAIFFMAMGAVVAGQLITNYSSNPVGMKHHIDHQMSPLGAFGFFTFMYTQGVTANVLSVYMKNPKFHFLIPHMGMAVGAFTQAYLSQILTDPNVKACAKVLMGGSVSESDKYAGVDADPCEKSYEYLVLRKQLWNQAPTLISMFLSSVAGAYLQKAATVAVRLSKGAILRWIGAEIPLLILPGGVQSKGIRLLLIKGLQIGVFVSLDMWFNSKINFAWKNFWDGADFKDASVQLSEKILDQKKKNWSLKNNSLQQSVKDLHKKSADWRMLNLAEVYQAHQNWSEMLHQLMGMYNASSEFYEAFVNEVRDAQGGHQNRPLNITYPMNGVKAKGLAEGKEDLYFTHPKNLEDMQMETVIDVVAYMDSNLKNGTYKRTIAPYRESQRRSLLVLETLRDQMARKTIEQKAEGIQLLLQYIEGVAPHSSRLRDKTFYAELNKIRSMLGEPRPLLEKGQGFGATYESLAAHKDTLKDVNFYSHVGLYKTKNITDYFIMQMLCGPDVDKNESPIRSTKGFPSLFLPPQIKNSNHKFSKEFCFDNRVFATSLFSSSAIYSREISIADGEKAYNGAIAYLKENTRASVLGDEKGSSFATWWKSKTEQDMISSFDNFSDQYQEIVAKLVKGIFSTKVSSWNRGPMKNGTIESLYQESRVYHSILAELMRDLYKTKNQKELPTEYLSTKFVALQYTGTLEDQKSNKRTLLDYLAWYPSMKFGSAPPPSQQQPAFILKDGKRISNPKATKMPMQSSLLAVQENFEKEMDGLRDLLKRIKIKQIRKSDSLWNKAIGSIGKGSREVIESDLENYQLEEQLQKIQAVLKSISDLMGISEDQTETKAIVELSKQQRELAATCLENLQAVATEMMMYGTIANAVTWSKIRNLKAVNMEQQKFNNKVQEMLSKMRTPTSPSRTGSTNSLQSN